MNKNILFKVTKNNTNHHVTKKTHNQHTQHTLLKTQQIQHNSTTTNITTIYILLHLSLFNHSNFFLHIFNSINISHYYKLTNIKFWLKNLILQLLLEYNNHTLSYGGSSGNIRNKSTCDYFCQSEDEEDNEIEDELDMIEYGIMMILILRQINSKYLRKGWTMNYLSEDIIINNDTQIFSMDKYIEYGSIVLHKKYILSPTILEELNDCANEFKNSVFPGCIGSTDTTHIVMEKCSNHFIQLHLGYKLTCIARTYNLTVYYERRILSTTQGHLASLHNKFLILFDDYVNSLEKRKN